MSISSFFHLNVRDDDDDAQFVQTWRGVFFANTLFSSKQQNSFFPWNVIILQVYIDFTIPSVRIIKENFNDIFVRFLSCLMYFLPS